VDVTPPSQIFMPIVARNYAAGPDLVVERILATSNNVQVVIGNQGDRPVTDEFWVDAYINPSVAPTAVNQTWNQLGSQGLVWGVTADILPALAPGGMITLTVGDSHYWADISQISWPLLVGTLVYAQVDSANTNTTYGAVLESHEITGGEYNNIASSDSTLAMSTTSPPIGRQASPSPGDELPPRP